MPITLILGGVRSGKSARGEQLTQQFQTQFSAQVKYVATGSATDDQMQQRISLHQQRRPADWQTVECQTELVAACTVDRQAMGDQATVLLDGVGPWIATVMHVAGLFEDFASKSARRQREAEVSDQIRRQVKQLTAEFAESENQLVVVAEQSGEGTLPVESASRLWLDLLGEATQTLAAAAVTVEQVTAGQVQTLKGCSAEADRPMVTQQSVVGHAPANSELAALRKHGDRDVLPGMVDHAVNVMADGAPQWLKKALHLQIDAGLESYPNPDAATAAVAKLHGLDRAEVLITNGAADAFWLISQVLQPTHAACVVPGFTEVEAALRTNCSRVSRVAQGPASDFIFDPGLVPADADLVVVGNPSSPAGVVTPAKQILALLKPGRTVVVDEAFMDMVPGEPESLVPHLAAANASGGQLIVVRSLTKSLGLAGLRAGYLLASYDLVAQLNAARQPWSVNALALVAIESVCSEPEVFVVAAARAQAERSDLEQRLKQLSGVHVWPSQTNYLLIKVTDGHKVTQQLRDRNIAVRNCASFPGLSSDYLRLTARGSEQNAGLVRQLDDAITLVALPLTLHFASFSVGTLQEAMAWGGLPSASTIRLGDQLIDGGLDADVM